MPTFYITYLQPFRKQIGVPIQMYIRTHSHTYICIYIQRMYVRHNRCRCGFQFVVSSFLTLGLNIVFLEVTDRTQQGSFPCNMFLRRNGIYINITIYIPIYITCALASSCAERILRTYKYTKEVVKRQILYKLSNRTQQIKGNLIGRGSRRGPK